VYKLTIFYFQNAKKVLQQDLSARTTFIILIIDYTEIILGHEVLSGIIVTPHVTKTLINLVSP
jgi:hypothetical protein